MSRVVRVAVALALTAGARVAAAQGARGGEAATRALLARAEALQAQLARQDSVARQARYAELRARRFDAGDLTVLLPAAVGEVTGRRIATGAWAYLDTLGAIPAGYVRSLVAVAYEATERDSVTSAEGLQHRTRVMVEVPAHPDTLADGWTVAIEIARAYVDTLDADWRAWLPFDLGIGWKHGREDAAALRDLAAAATRTGSECLGGTAAGCRLWLGLDRDPDPFASRYTVAEIRQVAAARPFYEYMGPVVTQCVGGSDEACLRFARSGQVRPVPASTSAIRSVLREVRVVHGAAALRGALADTTGAIGQRLARAAGIGEDSLVREWREWLLTGGGGPRIAAGFREAMPVLVFGGLLLLAAARSGRWR